MAVVLCRASCTAGVVTIMIVHSPLPLVSKDGLPCGGFGRIMFDQGSAYPCGRAVVF